MEKNILFSILFFPVLLIMGCSGENGGTHQKSTNTSAQDKIMVTPDEHDFMLIAAEGSMTELALGRFASGKSSDQRLKDYGFMMIREHEAMLYEIKKIASVRHISLPDTVNTMHQEMIASLSSKAGNPFDSSYMSIIISHQKMLADKYGRTSKISEDSDVRTYARDQLPVLMGELLEIITIRDSININKK